MGAGLSHQMTMCGNCTDSTGRWTVTTLTYRLQDRDCKENYLKGYPNITNSAEIHQNVYTHWHQEVSDKEHTVLFSWPSSNVSMVKRGRILLGQSIFKRSLCKALF